MRGTPIYTEPYIYKHVCPTRPPHNTPHSAEPTIRSRSDLDPRSRGNTARRVNSPHASSTPTRLITPAGECCPLHTSKIPCGGYLPPRSEPRTVCVIRFTSALALSCMGRHTS